MINSPTNLNDNEVNLGSRSYSTKSAETIEILLSQIDSLRKTLLCSICVETLERPHTLHCGHTFCGPCLLQWFHVNKVCPSCRISVQSPPAISYTLQEQLCLLHAFDKKNYPQVRHNLEHSNIELSTGTNTGEGSFLTRRQYDPSSRVHSSDKPDPFITGEIWDPIFALPEPLCSTRISEDTTFNSTNTMEQFDFPPSNYLSFLRNSALSSSSFAPSIISNLDQDEHYVREDGFSDIQDPPTIRRNPDLWVSESADLSTTPTHSQRQNHRFGIPTSILDWSEQVGENSILSDNGSGYPNDSFSENGENSLVSHSSSEDAETSLDTLSCHHDSDSNSLNSDNSRPLEYLGSNIASKNIYCSSPMIPCLSPPLEESFLHGASEITSECSSINTRRFKSISSSESQCPNCGWHFSVNGDVESTNEGESSNHSDVISTTDSSSMTEQAQIADMYNPNGSSSDQQFSSDEDKDVSIFSDSLALQSQESYQNSDMEEFDLQVFSSTSDTHEYNGTLGLLIDQSSGLFSNMWDSALGYSDIQMNPSFLEQVFLDLQETRLQDSFAYDSEDSSSSDINIQCNVEIDSLSSGSDES